MTTAQTHRIRLIFRHLSFETGIIYTLTLLTLFCFLVYPMATVLLRSVYIDGVVRFDFFSLMFENPIIRASIENSFKIALVTTALTSALCFPLARIMSRYEFPLKWLFQGLLLVPMIMPPFVGVIGLQILFSQYGSINLALIQLGLLDPMHPIDWLKGGGFWGVVILEVLHLYPLMYLTMVSAMSNIDPSMEEAASSVGASPLKRFWHITVPLVVPGYFAGAIVVFIWALTDLGTPLMFGYEKVMPVQIFNMTQDINENPMGFALVVLVIALTLAAFWVSKQWIGKRRYEMLSRGHTSGVTRTLPIAPRIGVYLFLLIVIAIALIPQLGVLLVSLSTQWAGTILPDGLTVAHYGEVLSTSLARTGIVNSIGLATLSTLVDIVLGIVIAYMLTRKRLPGADLLDLLVMLPLALPGIVIAFGYVATFSGTLLDPRDNPIPLLVIGYAVRRLPYMVRSAYAGFQQTSVTLEEASHSLGASSFQTITKITGPLILANLIAGAILCFAFAMLETSESLILAMSEPFYPLTKAIYTIYGRIGDGHFLASALGVLGMVILAGSMVIAGRVLGKRLGELFSAG